MLDFISTILLQKIGVNGKVLNTVSLSGGRQHLIYKIELENNRNFVIKELNFVCYLGNYSLDHFNLTETFAAYVNEKLLNTLIAFKINNNFTISCNGKSYLLFPWSKGVNTYNINNNHCQTIAKLLAHIHSLAPIKLNLKPIPKVNFNFGNWLTLLNKFVSHYELQQLIKLSEHCQLARDSYKDQRVLSHRDINLENILWLSDKDAILIDWESAGFIAPLVELLGVATNLGGIASGRLDLKLVKATIDAYKVNLNCKALKMNQKLYLQAYASWFHWLDYCLSNSSFSQLEREREIKITLKAINLLEDNQEKIISFF